jgi:DNA-binding XRE family transcriptional regulator
MEKGISEHQRAYKIRIKTAREKAGKTHQQVADAINVARNTYTAYELPENVRTMPQKYIARFCAFLKVNEKWLLSGSGPMTGTADEIGVILAEVDDPELRARIKEKVETYARGLVDSQK